MTLRRLISAVLAVSTVVALVSVGTTAAQAKVSADALAQRIVVHVRVSTDTPKPVPPGGDTTPGASECTPGLGLFNRFDSCRHSFEDVTYTRGGRVIGYARFDGYNAQHLNAKDRVFTGNFFLRATNVAGFAAGTVFDNRLFCDKPCTGGGFATVTAQPGASVNKTFRFSDATSSIHNDQLRVFLVIVKAGTPPGFATVKIGQPFRCDNKLKGQGAGCVHPGFTPTITGLRQLNFVGQNIRRLQSRGAPRLLHRNSFLTNANRAAVCGKAKLPPGWRPPPGWPLPPTGLNKPSCDEYAFAATNEGGAKPGNSYGWVPLRENSRQGNMLKNFYYANRVLDATSARARGDAFSVAV